MRNKKNKSSSEFDVQEWFRKLDRFNAIERFDFDREQPPALEREPLGNDGSHGRGEPG